MDSTARNWLLLFDAGWGFFLAPVPAVAAFDDPFTGTGEEATYTLKKEDGTPANDLEPYLGAPAHVAIVSEDTREFAHTHGEANTSGNEAASSGSHGDQGGAEGEEHAGHGEGQTFGPEIGFHHTFESPGLYKLWAQFNHHGSVTTVPFVVEVA